MITLVMAGILLAAVYSAYSLQKRTYYTQDQVVEMQQNIRSAVELMSKEIRVAKYDPTGKAGASITTATATQFAFTADLNGDGDFVHGADTDTNEKVAYCLKASGGGCDADGKADTGSTSVTRNGNAIADDIERIEFFYLFDDGTAPTSSPSAAELAHIRTVKITLLSVASKRDAKYTNSKKYITGSGATWSAGDDNFRRRLVVASVNIRNQGLN